MATLCSPPEGYRLSRLRIRTLLVISIAVATAPLQAHGAPPPRMQLGVDADNWSGQIADPAFESSLREMKIDFISWHIAPEEEADPERLKAVVTFCRRNHWHYLFNTEIANYRREENRFRHQDGTYRYDLAETTLESLKDDPLFVGMVYDEADVMQSLLGMNDDKSKLIQPYLADTRNLTASEAFLAVADRVAELTRRYAAYKKSIVFEMTFPDYPFAFARGGGLLAPKLLKENYNDLMYDVYRGAALEYRSSALWACVDLWFLDKFPFAGKYGPSDHTPEQLLETLEFAYSAGFDSVYIEQVKGLMDESYHLTEYGRKVIEFQRWREAHEQGNWRTAPIQYYVRRFPDGYWGQSYSTFIPDHPYGSWKTNPYRSEDAAWFGLLHQLSGGTVPTDADTWNAQRSSDFMGRPYQTMAGLPPMVIFDQYGTVPAHTKAKVFDLLPTTSKR